MHNLNLYKNELEDAVKAAKASCLEEHLIEFATKRIHQGKPLEALSHEFPTLKKKMGRTIYSVARSKKLSKHNVSLKYKSTDFKIPDNYKIPKGKRILFLFPCSKEKPYSTSQTYKRISAAVNENLNGTAKKIHFVVLSGLYGPVPLKYDRRPEIKNYDFVLTFRNHKGIEQVGDRLAQYIKIHAQNFDHIVAFAASKPYRKAILKGINGFKNAQIFPKHKLQSSTGRTAQFQQGLEQCIEFLSAIESGANDLS
jgi:predicted RNA-binding protein